MRKSSGQFYRREISKIGLSLERCTDKVSDDGKFYILRDGQVIEALSSEKKAVARFREIAEDIGFAPDPTDQKPRDPFQEHLDKYFEAAEVYWAQSYKYREKGGPGR